MAIRKTAKGRVCVACRHAKQETEYATTKSDTCLDCVAEAERTPQAPVDALPFVPPDAEVDYTAPTAKELASRTLARRRLIHFIKRFRPKYMAGWVHEDICRRLERFVKDVEAGKEPRLLLMMPVRTGKSEIASRHFAPWVLGQFPEWEIIAASGAQSLATSFSRYIRDLVRSESYSVLFPEMKLDQASQSVENWNTTKQGGYLAAGIGTMITGRGAHILIIDDPVKDAEASDSQVIRDNTWEWYMSTALSRLAPGGGVLGIMCMTGDTPVLMADGTQRRLDTLTPSDAIATYANGILAATTVKALRSNGSDFVLKITMRSGKIVRANQRHPFLTVLPNGCVTWVRLKNLTSASRIVTVKGSGVSGETLPALPRGVKNLPCVADYVRATTEKSTGRQDTDHRLITTSHAETLVSSTGMGSPQRSTTLCTLLKKAAALFALSLLKKVAHLLTGRPSSQSTTATTQVKSEGCCATTATQGSDILPMSRWHYPPQHISDFTLDEVVSIEPVGVEEVFDVQVEHTENFIANGLVSHNTWWNEDDWAGRVQQLSGMDDADTFEIVKYPAINDQGDEYILPDDSIAQLPPGSTVPEGSTLTRKMNTALHPERYTLEMLLRRKATYAALGQQRWWSALYQQSPSVEDGVYFTKNMFKFYTTDPHPLERRTFQAWDFAITEKQKSDYTVGSTGHVDASNNLHVADVVRFKSDDAFIIADAILDNWEKHGSCATLGFEDGQIWKAVSAVFLRRCEERSLFPSYELLAPLSDKGARAMPLKGLMQGGKVWFKDKVVWWEATRKELTQFMSGGKHDDIVDSLSWLARLALKHVAPRVAAPPPVKSWKDRLGALMKGQVGGHMSA